MVLVTATACAQQAAEDVSDAKNVSEAMPQFKVQSVLAATSSQQLVDWASLGSGGRQR